MLGHIIHVPTIITSQKPMIKMLTRPFMRNITILAEFEGAEDTHWLVE